MHRHRSPGGRVDPFRSHGDTADGWDERADGHHQECDERTDHHGGEADRETRPTPRSSPNRSPKSWLGHDGQSGTSHSAPSGGRFSVADAGWPCNGCCSAFTEPMLPVPEPP